MPVYCTLVSCDKMSAVNLLSELLDVRARRLEIYGCNTDEIDCLISSVCRLVIDTFLFLLFAFYYFILYYAVRFHSK